ncbi:hypothetical protein PRK78_003516 [Emydomyces testavorans]|uniref:Peptidase M43 pregnancy-associated plasma-A domain-containing protein n=1 Tax=Emydomyces testavorans TaxID=2070801 RepID=A0AAF0IKN4_9EURO|nr:hypothetical protein PRK78_003516 [Emydomyces testavorans]
MRLSSSLLSLAAAGSFVAAHTRFECGTEPDPEYQALAAKVTQSDPTTWNGGIEYEVKTYIHVVAASQSVEDGNISDKMIQDQFDVLNKAYAPHGFKFNHVNTSRTINPTWANGEQEMEMKGALRTGTYADLNVYFLKQFKPILYANCPFPSNYRRGLPMYIRDGCMIPAASVPGGSAPDYNLGITTVHEVGHFMGIYHTFQGRCSSTRGDDIADTPAQLNGSEGCPEGRDSCPDEPGLDPIHNFMDTSTDACRYEFTPLQGAAMRDMYKEWRYGKP